MLSRRATPCPFVVALVVRVWLFFKPLNIRPYPHEHDPRVVHQAYTRIYMSKELKKCSFGRTSTRVLDNWC